MRVWWLVWLLALPVRDAAACVIIVGDQKFVAGESTESVPPGPVTAGSATVRVTEPTNGAGCRTAEATGCRHGRFAVIGFSVAADDDTTPNDQLGYRLRVIGPSPSFGLFSGFRDRIPADGAIDLMGEIGDDDIDFDFELGVSAIDLSGNVGPETTVLVSHRSGGGCRAARNVPIGAAAVALATCALILRRRQRSRGYRA